VLVVDDFSNLPKHNDRSFTAHIGIACFLAAAHELMYEYLKRPKTRRKLPCVLGWDYGTRRGVRRTGQFFAQVAERANNVSASLFLLASFSVYYQSRKAEE
jgi:hypothetical protein